jgi:hypothetical protein
MKMSKLLLCFIVFGMTLTAGMATVYAQLEAYRGIVHRTQVNVCMDSCGIFYLQPDSGYSFTYLRGELNQYVGLHIEVRGYRVFCVECDALAVTQILVLPPISVEGYSSFLPQRTVLRQNYPNPFNPSTNIRFAVKEISHVSLIVFNLLGQSVATLVNEELYAGEYETRFSPAGFASGIYFYRLQSRSINEQQANDYIETKKLILMR